MVDNDTIGRRDSARDVADAVLHEGYVLYPYRATAAKNQLRWQFGVLTPPEWSDVDPTESPANQTECLLVPGHGAEVLVTARFMQVESRVVDEWTGTRFGAVSSLTVDDEEFLSWDEGIDQEVEVTVSVADLLTGSRTDFEIPPSTTEELVHDTAGELRGRVRRERHPLTGVVHVEAEFVDDTTGLVRLRTRVVNTTASDRPADRDAALRQSMVSAHTILTLTSGEFLSLTDPPEWARAAAHACDSQRCWPVLIGDEQARDVMLASPIIMDDFPAVAPESPGDFYDATEIDELLSLRTITLTDDEKRQARATDPRAAGIVDRAETMTAGTLAKLHGTIRSQRALGPDADEDAARTSGASVDPSGEPEAGPAWWWSPEAEASVSPETEYVIVAGTHVGRGASVRLHPVRGRADVQDMFLDGRAATVHAVFRDVDDGRASVAVTVDDDPAADLLQSNRRYLHFSTDEIEPAGDDV